MPLLRYSSVLRANRISHPASRRRLNGRRRNVTTIALATLSVLIVSNAIILACYRGRTYPHSQVATFTMGSVSRSQLTSRLQAQPLLPREVRLIAGAQTITVSTQNLPVKPDYPSISQRLLGDQSWIPLANIFSNHQSPILLQVDYLKLTAYVDNTIIKQTHQASDAKIERKNGTFSLEPDITGQQLDTATVSRQLLAGLQSYKAVIPLSSRPITAKVTAESLRQSLSQLQAAQKTPVTVRYGEHSKQFSAAELADWYAPDRQGFSLSDANIKNSLSAAGVGFGMRIQGLDQAVATAKNAVNTKKAASITLIAAPPAVKNINYCTAVRGVDPSNLATLDSKLASTYADPRGWSLDGLVSFTKVSSGCELTVWLSSADQMSSFNAICDSQWSCTVKPYVIINFDRWQNASDTWNAAMPNNLSDYRAMAINHETGHWFGFNHLPCTGVGQPAPVMEQQSIDLQGCTFNPWPTAAELATLKTMLGI